MAAESKLHEPIVDVATIHRSDLGSQKSTHATGVQLHVFLLGSQLHASPRSYCTVTALLLCFMGLFLLMLHPHCAATETMMLVIRPRHWSNACNGFTMHSYYDPSSTDPHPPPPPPTHFGINTASSLLVLL